MCADMCVDLCVDTCADMCVDALGNMRWGCVTQDCVHMPIDMCIDMFQPYRRMRRRRASSKSRRLARR